MGKALIFEREGSGQTWRVFQIDLRKIHLTAFSVPELAERETEATSEVVHKLKSNSVNGKRHYGVESRTAFPELVWICKMRRGIKRLECHTIGERYYN